MVLNSLNFCLSAKLFISSSILNQNLAGYSNVGCRFFPFSTLNISCHSLWPTEFLLKDQLLSIWGFPYMLYVASPLLLLIFFLCVYSFFSLISMCLGVFLLGFILYRTLCAPLTWSTISFSMLGKFSTIISSKIFSYTFFYSASGTPVIRMSALDIVPEVSETILSYFHSFYFILLFRSYFHHFIFQLTDSFFCFRYSAIDSF